MFRPRFFLFLLLFCFVGLTFTSCYSVKKIAYFQDLLDSSKNNINTNLSNSVFQLEPNDLIGIDIIATDPSVASPFNIGNYSSLGAYQKEQVLTNSSNDAYTLARTTELGWRIDSSGNINLPFLGVIKVAGMSTSQLSDYISSQLSKGYLKKPIVKVQLLNFSVNVIGETNGSNVSTVKVEPGKNSIIDILAQAKTSNFSNLKQVLVIRNQPDGSKEVGRLDLTNSNIFHSSYYYLKQGDIVYVAPRKERAVDSDVISGRLLGYISTTLGIIAFIISVSK